MTERVMSERKHIWPRQMRVYHLLHVKNLFYNNSYRTPTTSFILLLIHLSVPLIGFSFIFIVILIARLTYSFILSSCNLIFPPQLFFKNELRFFKFAVEANWGWKIRLQDELVTVIIWEQSFNFNGHFHFIWMKLPNRSCHLFICNNCSGHTVYSFARTIYSEELA